MSIELQYFDPDTPVAFTKRQIKLAAKSGNPSFVRACKVHGPSGDSIDEIVAMTDERLVDIASACGAKVINHTWGLYAPEHFPRAARSRRYVYPQELLPKDTVLVAEVDTVQDARPLQGHEQADLQPLLDAYYVREVMKGEDVLADLNPSWQMIRGAGPDGAEHNWVVDIDPIIGIGPFHRQKAFAKVLRHYDSLLNTQG